MAGPGDALAKEGRNMQKGFQDAHDLMMGQRPDGQYEVHGWADAQTIGPGEDSTEVTPMYSGPDVENDPLAFGPASAPAEEPDVSGDTYMAPAYDPTVGPVVPVVSDPAAGCVAVTADGADYDRGHRATFAGPSAL